MMAGDAGRTEKRWTHSGIPAQYHKLPNILLTGQESNMPHLDRQAVHQVLEPRVEVLGIKALKQLVALLLGCRQGARGRAEGRGGVCVKCTQPAKATCDEQRSAKNSAGLQMCSQAPPPHRPPCLTLAALRLALEQCHILKHFLLNLQRSSCSIAAVGSQPGRPAQGQRLDGSSSSSQAQH